MSVHTSHRKILALLSALIALLLSPMTAGAQSAEATLQSNHPLEEGSSGGTQAAGGDVSYQFGCRGEAWGGSGWVSVQVILTLNGQWIGYNYADGYDQLVVETGLVTIRASTQDQRVECWVNVNVANEDPIYAYQGASIPGSGPGSVTIVIRNFIIQEWIGDGGAEIFEGDNRSFTPYGGNARSVIVYDVFNPAVNDADVLSGPFYNVGMTVKYDRDSSLCPAPFGPICQAAKDDWEPGYPRKLWWAWASTDQMSCSSPQRAGQDGVYSTHYITCTASVTIPNVAGAPSIDYTYNFTLRYGKNKVEYWLNGCHDGFPSNEVYINGQPLLQDQQSGDILDLFGPCWSINQRNGFIY